MREFSLPALYEVPADGNLTDIVRRNAAQHPDVAVIARKVGGTWTDVTATAFLAEVQAAAKGLIASGVQPGDRVALMSRTRYEWTLLDFAIWSAGAVTVPVYETSSPEQVQWILGDSGAIAIVVELDAHAAAVESVRDRLPQLKHVWQIERGGIDELDRAGKDVSDAAVEERGSLAKADDPATIVYTSGTTGRPKGCVLTHRSFFAECGNIVERLRPLFRTGECSVLLFLPLAHVFGRLVQVAPMMAPIKLGMVPDIKNLTDELASFRPTLILGVPRVFEKVYNSARAKAQADGKGKIFDKAADTAIAYSRALDTTAGPSLGLRIKHKAFDALVYSKLRAVLGGKNVAPAVIEDRIRAHALVAECMVVGDGRPFVGALVTIDEEFLGRWAEEHGKPAGSTAASLALDPDLLAALQSAVDDGNAAVSKAESVRKFRVLSHQFTEDSGHLTPSLKLKRNVVAKDYAAEIEAIYQG
ncbi:AMP-dependent synthetase/ligase [Streptomyces sp. NPDC020707]|uniref:AMP-dependent synthetase/ligase n=1 Tax=Streptomyces sp. NPDC020707 TaxID=3365084 RepID=UPI003795E1FE